MDPQRFPRRGEHALAAAALEKRRAQFGLQFADLFAQRRLGKVQPGGGAGEVSLPGGFEEVFELVKFHRENRS